MSYVTQQQLVDRFGQARLVELTDRAEEATGEIGTDVLARAIADTDAMIDGFVAAQYTLPLASVPDILRDVGLTITFYKLHVDTVADKVKEDYEDARRTLEWISTGRVKLNIAGAQPEAPAREVSHVSAKRVCMDDYA